MKRQIGRTGAEVNAVGLGAWQLSNRGHPSEANGIALLVQAMASGVDFVDTADCYATDDSDFGHNERLVRAALDRVGNQHDVKIATKAGFRRPRGQWVPDGRPERIERCCEASLERLGVDSIFLYQLHTPDPAVRLEDTVGALANLKTQGKVQHIGLSNVSLEELETAQSITRIESVQNECNPGVRKDLENGLIRHCAQTGVTYLPYRPFGGKDGHRALSAAPLVTELADKYGVSAYCILVGWSLGLGERVVAIPGATRVESMLDNLGATGFEMSAEDRERLSRL